MNKVIVEGTITYADGHWLTISANNEDIHGYIKSHVQVFENDYVRAEGYLTATHMDANKFIITKIEVIRKRNLNNIDIIKE